MEPAARAETEARAERCLRRGELSEAYRLYQGLLAAFPEDPGLTEKLAHLRDNLDPSELRAQQAIAAAPTAELGPSTPEQEGERLFALGDYAGAAAAYRRALALRPDSVLVRERLEELFRLAQAAPRHSPTDARLPRDPRERLTALLDRISARRRLPSR